MYGHTGIMRGTDVKRYNFREVYLSLDKIKLRRWLFLVVVRSGNSRELIGQDLKCVNYFRIKVGTATLGDNCCGFPVGSVPHQKTSFKRGRHDYKHDVAGLSDGLKTILYH